MNFLTKEQHDQWLTNQFPKLSDTLLGDKGSNINSVGTDLKSGYFPIIDSFKGEETKPLYRAIVKLTFDEKPHRVSFNHQDQEVFMSIDNTNYQVLIIQVDKELNFIDSGHYPMNEINVS